MLLVANWSFCYVRKFPIALALFDDMLCFADYKQEQDMEIEALEAILMDEFKGFFF